MFDNKQENRIKIGNEWVFFPTVYDPILPSVIKNIGTIKVKKSLLNTHSLLTCQVSTESTCNVFYIYIYRWNTKRKIIMIFYGLCTPYRL